MNLLTQIQTPQGFLPVAKAKCVMGNCIEDSWIEFEFDNSNNSKTSSLNVSQSQVNKSPQRIRHSAENSSLENLAFLGNKFGEIDHILLENVASHLGPIFGANRRECVADWVSVSCIAKDLLQMQEVINGDKPYSFLNGVKACQQEIEQGGESPNLTCVDSADNVANTADETDNCATETMVAKCLVTNTATRNSFYMFSYTAPLCPGTTSAFFENMPAFPHFKKFSTGGSFEYAFFELSEDDLGKFVYITLFSFKRDITALDFAVALQALDAVGIIDEHFDANAIGSLLGQPCENVDLSLAGQLNVLDQPCKKGDTKHLQKLVHGIVSLFLGGISIDIFRSTKTDDYMVFSNYLTYLLYRFTRQSGNVRLGSCELCGRGFSLVGARGLARHYCSDACRTKAKNARKKKQRDKIRYMYMEEGASVSEIAEAIFDLNDCLNNKEKIAFNAELNDKLVKIRQVLRKYPALKQAIDADILEKRGGEFTKRCVSDGIFSVNEILSRAKYIKTRNVKKNSAHIIKE